MKKFYFNLILFIGFACLLTVGSCSNETMSHSTLAEPPTTMASFRAGTVFPGNSDNPYDIAGQLHNELFESYYASENPPNTVPSIVSRVETIANAHDGFNAIRGPGYEPVSADRVAYIISHPNSCVTEILEGSTLTSPAKTSLSDFISNITLLFNEGVSYDVLYSFIINYETGILNDPELTSRDTEIILTASSVARYSTYMSKKRPKRNTDPDWIIFVGNIAAAVEGAADGSATAITQALATGIAENQ